MLNLTNNSARSIQRLAVASAAFLLYGGACLSAQTGGAAKLIRMGGQVSVLRGAATWALNVGDTIQPHQMIVTGPDGSATFEVADGSTFEVFPNAKAIFRNTPGNWQDLLEMMIGRVKVEIQHLAGGQPNYNKVRTATAVISVRGTVFDVTVRDDQGTTLVLVEEGVVEVRHQLQPGTRILHQGEWVEVFWNQPLAATKVDHGAIIQRIASAAKDAMYEILMHSHTGTGTTPGTSSGGTSSDKNGTGTTDNKGGSGGSTGSAPPPPPAAPPPPPQ